MISGGCSVLPYIAIKGLMQTSNVKEIERKLNDIVVIREKPAIHPLGYRDFVLADPHKSKILDKNDICAGNYSLETLAELDLGGKYNITYRGGKNQEIYKHLTDLRDAAFTGDVCNAVREAMPWYKNYELYLIGSYAGGREGIDTDIAIITNAGFSDNLLNKVVNEVGKVGIVSDKIRWRGSYGGGSVRGQYMVHLKNSGVKPVHLFCMSKRNLGEPNKLLYKKRILAH